MNMEFLGKLKAHHMCSIFNDGVVRASWNSVRLADFSETANFDLLTAFKRIAGARAEYFVSTTHH